VGIKGLDAVGITALLADLHEPAYRAKQVVRWVYGRGATSFQQMTDVPAGLRETLAGRLAFPVASVVERQASRDGTRKYLLELADGATVETVGLPAGDRLTVCFSTQAANYDATLGALRLMNSADGLGIGARHLTVSTCGLTSAIERFATEPEQFTLAVSLHSAVQSTRDRLMPGVRGMPLEELRAALVAYAEKTGRRPSLEYALISGVNDTDAELDALAAYCRNMLVHVNLIPVNPVSGTGFERAANERADYFSARLQRAGIECSIRVERGADIDAACGQLRQRAEAGR